MPDFWEFPTVSMGLGPMNAIYQAQFNKYLHDRGIKDTSQQHVWAFLGDGEMDEPESRGLLQRRGQRGARQPDLRHQLQPAAPRRPGARQRQDHPGARGVLPRRRLERHQGRLGPRVGPAARRRPRRRAGQPDERHAATATTRPTGPTTAPTSASTSSAATRAPAQMVEDMSDDEVWWKLKRGGHDYRKVYAAYKAAMEHTGQPTVILAKTIKGYGLGPHFAGRNATHQMKKLTLDDLKRPARQPAHPDQRRAARGATPTSRRTTTPATTTRRSSTCASGARKLGGSAARSAGWQHKSLKLPDDSAYDGGQARARASSRSPPRWRSSGCCKDLMRDKDFGQRIVPIIPDEARTFGMDSFFPTAKIYNPHGQQYTSVDAELMLAYKESTQGQILHVGINEARLGRGVHRGRHVVRDARRADGPDLRLLLDVRVPAHRRLHLGGGRPDGPRLPHRRHRRPHHADRRGPAARRRPLARCCAATNPAVVAYDPAYALRDRAHRPGRAAPDVRRATRRTSSTTSPSTTSRSSSRRSPRTSTSRASCAACTCSRRPPRPGDGARGCSCSPPASAVPWALEAQELLADDWGVAADVW